MNYKIKSLFGDKVSVIVCTKDSGQTLKQCLESVVNNNPFELIIVDAKSKDQTLSIAECFTNRIYEDPGKGLGLARNIGLDKATGDYIFYVGPDNVIPEGTIKRCIETIKTTSYVGIAPCTLLDQVNNYSSKCLNLYKKARFFPGEKNTIGTPWFYKGEILRKYRFDPAMGWSDDTDLCERLRKDGHKIAIFDWFVYEIGQGGRNSIELRWQNYGGSDSGFYHKYSKDWGIFRKLKSLFHPLQADFIGVLFSPRISLGTKFFISPFLLYITAHRYYGWCKSHNKRNAALAAIEK